MRITTLSAAACSVALLLIPLGAGVAGAETGISVVGMSQSQAETTLSEGDVPYTILNRAGSTMQNCRVTEQRDRGYETEVTYEWNYDDEEWDTIETEVWRGLSLIVFCD